HSGVSSAQTCSSFCPASATKIYNGNGIEHAVASDGKRYSELATAFAYRKRIVPGCTCNGKEAFGLNTTPVADDPTLRPGDIVATNAGLMAYNGAPAGSTFIPISAYAGLSADLRRQLTETKIEPAAQEPAPPLPVRQAEATSARSTKNKRVQVDREGRYLQSNKLSAQTQEQGNTAESGASQRARRPVLSSPPLQGHVWRSRF